MRIGRLNSFKSLGEKGNGRDSSPRMCTSLLIERAESISRTQTILGFKNSIPTDNFSLRSGRHAEQFTFINPTDIAVGKDGTIYVMDWILIPIEGSDDPKIFNYGPCVHRFDAEGKFVASYPIQSLTQRIAPLESAVPGLDADGNYALIIPQGDVERSFLTGSRSKREHLCFRHRSYP